MAETISMPKLGFDMREGILVRWVKNEGDEIKKGDVLAEIETDKATVEVESSASGVVRKLFASQGDSIPVGNVIAVIGTADEVIDTDIAVPDDDAPNKKSTSNTSHSTTEKTKLTESTIPFNEVKASPLARKVASISQVDISKILGTGPAGRIVRRDVDAFLAKLKAEIPVSISLPTAPVKTFGLTGEFPSLPADLHGDEIIKTSKLRQAIGRRLVESKQNIPHFYVSHEFKMDEVIELRKQVNQMLPDGERISVNDFIVKAVALTLREFPNLNSSISGNEITQHGDVNVGVAVTIPGGLLTVVVKDTDQKSMRQISLEIKSMAARARNGKIKPEDVDGSTFSTSNLGMYDVENFTAIINPPEAAILAIGSSRDLPVVENEQIKIGSRMKCTISVDHRISDGSEAAQFMQALAKYLQEPMRLML